MRIVELKSCLNSSQVDKSSGYLVLLGRPAGKLGGTLCRRRILVAISITGSKLDASISNR